MRGSTMARRIAAQVKRSQGAIDAPPVEIPEAAPAPQDSPMTDRQAMLARLSLRAQQRKEIAR